MLCGHEASCSIDIGKSVWRIVEWYCLEMSSNAIGNRIKGTQNTFLYSVKASIFKGFQRKATFYYPVWHGQAPRIVSTFLESYDFSGKTIIPFCTSHSSGIGSSADNLHPLCSDSTEWLEGRRFAGGSSKATMEEWLSDTGISN